MCWKKYGSVCIYEDTEEGAKDFKRFPISESTGLTPSHLVRIYKYIK